MRTLTPRKENLKAPHQSRNSALRTNPTETRIIPEEEPRVTTPRLSRTTTGFETTERNWFSEQEPICHAPLLKLLGFTVALDMAAIATTQKNL
jgi:hypothetical protein